MAIVLTDGELVVGRSGLFGRWGSKLQRYDLSRLRDVHSVSYPAAHMLILSFVGTPPQSATFMYDRVAITAFEPILAALQQQAASNGSVQPH